MTCIYIVPGEGRCPAHPVLHGYCTKHVRESPQDRAAMDTLIGQLRSVKDALDNAAHRIAGFVINDAEVVPDDLRREYRALANKHRYLLNIRDSRRPGDPLPVEVTMVMR